MIAGMMARSRWVPVVLAVTAVALTGCGSSSSKGSTSGSSTSSASASSSASTNASTTGLSQALASVDAGPVSERYFEWSDLGAVAKLAGGSPTAPPRAGTPWSDAFGIGTTGAISDPVAPQLASRYGLELSDATSAITIGFPPRDATRILGPGVDASRLTAALVHDGARRSGRFLAFGPQGSVNVTNPAVTGAFTVVGLDRVLIGDHSFASGPFQAPVIAVLGGGRPVGSVPAYQAAQTCLGDVVWAAIAPGATVGVPSSELVAIGGRRPASASAPITEVLCAVDTGSAVAAAQQRRLRRALSPTALLLPADEPVARALRSSEVDGLSAGGLQVARATLMLAPRTRAPFLYMLQNDGSLGQFLVTSCDRSVIRRFLGRDATPADIAAYCKRSGLPSP